MLLGPSEASSETEVPRDPRGLPVNSHQAGGLWCSRICNLTQGKISWSRALRLPGREVANPSCLAPNGKGIRAPTLSHKGKYFLYHYVLSPQMNLVPILSWPGLSLYLFLAGPSRP